MSKGWSIESMRRRSSPEKSALAASRPAARLNDMTGRLIALVTFLAPIPVASHRPIFWLMWAAILGFGLALHQVMTLRLDPRRRIRVLEHKWVLICVAALVAFICFQLVPLGVSLSDRAPGLASSGAITVDAPQTTLGLVRLLTFLALFVLVTETATNGERVRKIGWAIYAGIVAHAIWGLMVLTVFDGFDFLKSDTSYADVATGTFINRNSFATYLGMGLCLGISLILNDTLKPRMRRPFRRFLDVERMERLILWLSVVLLFFTLLKTESRMGLAASLCGVFVVVLIMRQKARGLWIAGLQAVAAIVAGPFLATLFFGQGVLNRSVLGEVALDTRLELYRQTVEMIKERPFTGWGLDSFASAFPLFHAPPLSSAVIWDLAHNSYLGLWAELGLIAGSIPMALLAGAAIGLVRRIVRRNSHFVLPVAALGALVVGGVHSLVDFSLEIEANTFLLIVLVALGLAHLRSTKGAV